MRAARAALITFASRDFHSEGCREQANNHFADSAITLVSAYEKRWITPMIKTLIGAAAMAAVAFAVVPAHAAKRGVGCSGDNLTKTESAVEAMADTEVKFMAEREISLAQDAMLNGRMGECGMHLSKAAHASMAK